MHVIQSRAAARETGRASRDTAEAHSDSGNACETGGSRKADRDAIRNGIV